MKLRRYLLRELTSEPPTEFLIFRVGANEATSPAAGPEIVYFDEAAAESVMADYRKHGVQLIVDLNHQSFTADAYARPDAGDARGWFDLELRNGELWGVNVTWSPDGERRLRERTQRYISPAFDTDDDARVTRLYNVALVSMPATDHAVPLVAHQGRREAVGVATLTTEPVRVERQYVELRSANTSIINPLARVARPAKVRRTMDPEKIKAALEAIKSGDAAAALALLEEMVAAAAGAGGEPSADGTGEEGALAESPDDPPEDEQAAQAAARALRAVLGVKSVGEAVTVIRDMRARIDRLDADRAALDLSSRRELVTELVKLGFETPATAWAERPVGEDESKPRMPCARLMGEPIADLRARVAALRASRPVPIERPESRREKLDTSALTQREIDAARKRGWTPEEYAARKANAVRRQQRRSDV